MKMTSPEISTIELEKFSDTVFDYGRRIVNFCYDLCGTLAHKPWWNDPLTIASLGRRAMVDVAFFVHFPGQPPAPRLTYGQLWRLGWWCSTVLVAKVLTGIANTAPPHMCRYLRVYWPRQSWTYRLEDIAQDIIGNVCARGWNHVYGDLSGVQCWPSARQVRQLLNTDQIFMMGLAGKESIWCWENVYNENDV